MILGPSGKNIYPEEIESVINNQKYITEAVVISENNKLVALVFPDYDQLKNDNVTDDQFKVILDQIKETVNDKLPEYMSVSRFRIHDEEFVKTPKRSIKRYLYTKE